MVKGLKVLVVDDDPRIRTMLRRYLTDEGMRVAECADGQAARSAMAGGAIGLVLLDLGLPGEDGLSLAREIRRRSDVPIIMLTGKGDVIDRVAGLEAGADDYIVKPFHLREVLARIRTVTRRTGAGAAAPECRDETPQPPATATAPAAAANASQGRIVFDGWSLDPARRELRNPQGAPVALTGGEFDLLLAFARHPNQVLSRDRLMDLAKGRSWAAGYDRAIDTQIGRLRKKVEADPGRPQLIKTVRGAGYVFATRVGPTLTPP